MFNKPKINSPTTDPEDIFHQTKSQLPSLTSTRKCLIDKLMQAQLKFVHHIDDELNDAHAYV